MGRLVSKYKRSGVWYLRYAPSIGIPRRSLNTSDAKLAEAIRIDEEHRLLFRRNGIKEGVVENVRYSELVRRYLSHKESQDLSKRTIENYVRTLNIFGQSIRRDEYADNITVEMLEAFARERREAGFARKTVRNEMFSVATLLRWAYKRRYITSDPTRGLELPRPVKYAPRPLKFEQYLALKKAINDEAFKDVVDFYLLTGIRRADGPILRFSEHVDIEARAMHLPQQKQKDYKVLPISDELLPVLERLKLRAKGSDRIIPYHKSDLSKKFRKYADAAGLPKELTLHSLRHSFGTWLAEAGVGMKIIQRLIGHRDPRSTDIYVGAFEEGLIRGIDKLKLPRAQGEN